MIEKLETPELALTVFFAGSFLLGLIITYFFSLYGKFKSNQTIKGLNQKIDSFMEKNSKLEAENDSLKTALMDKNRKTTPRETASGLEEQPAAEAIDVQEPKDKAESNTQDAKS